MESLLLLFLKFFHHQYHQQREVRINSIYPHLCFKKKGERNFMHAQTILNFHPHHPYLPLKLGCGLRPSLNSGLICDDYNACSPQTIPCMKILNRGTSHDFYGSVCATFFPLPCCYSLRKRSNS